MHRDVKLLLLSIALLVVGIVALQVTMSLQSVAGPAHTIDNTRYHGLAISSLVLLFLGAAGIFAASVALSGRLSGSQSLMAGGAFLVFAGMVWWISKEFELASYSWMAVMLLPWCVAVLSGAILVVVGIARVAVFEVPLLGLEGFRFFLPGTQYPTSTCTLSRLSLYHSL